MRTRDKLTQVRREQVSRLEIASRYERDFTATFVLRQRSVAELAEAARRAGLPVDEAPPEPQAPVRPRRLPPVRRRP